MSRAALSAFRALDMIDLLAGAPGEAFTLSDIARMTDTNPASTHAILGALVERGYLLRHPRHKTYRLAPAVAAIGEAAAAHDPLLAGARNAAHAIAELTGLETILTARAGGDIIGVAYIPSAPFPRSTLRVGQRVPLRPPLGGLFFAWAPPEEAEAWIAPPDRDTSSADRQRHRDALALLRARGFLISLRSPEQTELTRTLITRAEAADDADPGRIAALISELDNTLYQPDRLDPDTRYEFNTLSAPIFDPHGRVLFTLGLHGFPEPMTGREMDRLARTLLDICAGAARENRSARAG